MEESKPEINKARKEKKKSKMQGSKQVVKQ